MGRRREGGQHRRHSGAWCVLIYFCTPLVRLEMLAAEMLRLKVRALVERNLRIWGAAAIAALTKHGVSEDVHDTMNCGA